MFNINLNNVYAVQQVNHEVGDSTTLPSSWQQGPEGAINDVVDPNTEFKSHDQCSTPASPLESYGFPTPPHTPSVYKKMGEPTKHTECDVPAALSPISAAVKVLSYSSDIPQVHAYISNTKMAQGSLQNSTMDSEPDMIPYPRSDITITTERRPYLPLSATETKNSVFTSSVPPNLKIQGRSQPKHSFSFDNLVTGVDRNTTSDQIAWAMRSARNRLETASNISGCSSKFDLESNCSERADSVSTYSDVSGYEEELFRIRRLLLQQDSSSLYLDKHVEKHCVNAGRKHNESSVTPSQGLHSSFDAFKENTEIQIRNLNSQLQAALAEKEKIRIERNDAGEKAALEWQQKYQDVLRLKANADGRLEALEAEVNTLRASTVNKLKVSEMQQEREEVESELEKFRNMYREAQAKQREQSLQLELKESEIARWKSEAQDTETTNERFRLQLLELKVDTEMKDGAVQGLKMKVADQHVELQTLLQAKLKAENSTVTLKNEIETIRKSNVWYKEQLHACQAAKVKVQQELMTSQANVVTYSHLVEKLKSEAANLRSIAEETQQRAVREKDGLMRKLEKIHEDMLQRESIILSQIRSDGSSVESSATKLVRTDSSFENELKDVTEDFEQKIVLLKLELKDREDKVFHTETENMSLMQKISNLQTALNEKELALNSLQIKYKNIEMNNNMVSETLRLKEKSLLDMKNEKVVMEVAITAAAREKEEVDVAIEKLRDDVARITKSYQLMRRDLRLKENETENMQQELRGLKTIRDQQEQKISKYVKEFEQQGKIQEKLDVISDLELRLFNLSHKNEELNNVIGKLNETNIFSAQQIDKLKEMLTFREEQLVNQTHSFEVHADELRSRDTLILSLNTEKSTLLNLTEELHLKIRKIEEELVKKSKEIDMTNDQLQRCSYVIDQFNSLCQGSALENHHLKQLVKELDTVPFVAVKSVKMTQTVQINAVNCTSQTTEEHIPGVASPHQDELKKELEQVKCSLRMSEIEKQDKQRRYETSIRTLLKKVKEHMRGRKAAEKALTELQSGASFSATTTTEVGENNVEVTELKTQIARLEAEVELGRQQFAELKKISERSDAVVLELEKERGKLVQVNSIPPHSKSDVKEHIASETSRVEYLEEELRKQHIIIKDLKKEIFIDRRENSQLRKQVSSIQMGLDTANDVLDNKKIDLGRSEAMSEILRNTIACLQQELEKEQFAHEDCKQVVETLKMELDDTRAKDPVLADQIKMLSYHLHEKTQEAASLQECKVLSEERWAATEHGLKHSIDGLRDEIASLREELNDVRADKFTLQAQAVELRTVLQSSLEQNKVLRSKVNAYDSAMGDVVLPDLTSSLPSAPLIYDEREIAELLQPRRAVPHNAPLNNLQSCLDMLKQEMATLQEQLIAKTSQSQHTSNGIHKLNNVLEI